MTTKPLSVIFRFSIPPSDHEVSECSPSRCQLQSTMFACLSVFSALYLYLYVYHKGEGGGGVVGWRRNKAKGVGGGHEDSIPFQ
jgi:hypothetical protein